MLALPARQPCGWRPGGPGARQLPLAHGREYTQAVAAIGPAPVVPLSQVAVDTVGLMEALGIDRADVSGGSGGGPGIAQVPFSGTDSFKVSRSSNPQLF